MTTDEIKALIAQTIEGQGDAIDVGGGLAKILTALAEKVDTKINLILPASGTASANTADEFAAIFGITADELNRMFAGEYLYAYDSGGETLYVYAGGNNGGRNGYFSAAFVYGQSDGGISVRTFEFSPKRNTYILRTHLAEYSNA